MQAHKKRPRDVPGLLPWLVAQFAHLDPQNPCMWPAAPRLLLGIGIALLTLALAWQLHVSRYEAALQAERQEEHVLRENYQKKLARAAGLEGLKQQRAQVQVYVMQLEQQLPGKAEMAALLSAINQAGLERSLQFELFRPGAEVLRDYYAELPMALRVSGSYHDMGAFAADIAQLPRIVTLSNISMAPVTMPPGTGPQSAGHGGLVMEATARTFRYLDAEELAARKAAGDGKKGGR